MRRHIRLTVGELRKLIHGLDDDTPVLVPASSHEYRPAKATLGVAVYDHRYGWSEDFGDMNPDTVTEDDRKSAIVVSGE